MPDQIPSQRESHVTRTQYRACGDYSGTERALETRITLDRAASDAASMTQADRVWIETRVVVEGPWEAHDAA